MEKSDEGLKEIADACRSEKLMKMVIAMSMEGDLNMVSSNVESILREIDNAPCFTR